MYRKTTPLIQVFKPFKSHSRMCFSLLKLFKTVVFLYAFIFNLINLQFLSSRSQSSYWIYRKSSPTVDLINTLFTTTTSCLTYNWSADLKQLIYYSPQSDKSSWPTPYLRCHRGTNLHSLTQRLLTGVIWPAFSDGNVICTCKQVVWLDCVSVSAALGVVSWGWNSLVFVCSFSWE